ncbi:MAG: hypothetical protein AUI10_00580 [Actinobacteria bacterium 13_2_20CM_2_72_6]|nr:MAG: hypothetical protein AUI10_00580 [Actinobacteria bacterium 13_2_20CM_2_72_6]
MPPAVSCASQKDPIAVPAGRSNWTVQLDMAAVPALVMVNLASQPVPQSDVFTNVPVGPAACAIVAVPTTATAPSTSPARP